MGNCVESCRKVQKIDDANAPNVLAARRGSLVILVRALRGCAVRGSEAGLDGLIEFMVGDVLVDIGSHCSL